MDKENEVLELGRIAIVKVDEYGLLEVRVVKEECIAGRRFYLGNLLSVLNKEVVSVERTEVIKAMVEQGKQPNIMLKANMLVEYK